MSVRGRVGEFQWVCGQSETVGGLVSGVDGLPSRDWWVRSLGRWACGGFIRWVGGHAVGSVGGHVDMPPRRLVSGVLCPLERWFTMSVDSLNGNR